MTKGGTAASDMRLAIMQADLTPAAKIIAIRMLDLQGRRDGVCKRSGPSLATELGWQPRTVEDALRQLRRTGWIETVESTHNRAWRRVTYPTATRGPKPTATRGDTDVQPTATQGLPHGYTGGTPREHVVYPTATRGHRREDPERIQERIQRGDAGGSAPPRSELTLSSPPPKPRKRRQRKPKPPAPTAATWAAYAEAYERRYGVAPVRNATVNGQLNHLVQRLGANEASKVAGWYVSHNRPYYVQRCHDVGSLLKDWQALRTQWATGRRVTRGDAREAERRDELAAQSARVEAMLADGGIG